MMKAKFIYIVKDKKELDVKKFYESSYENYEEYEDKIFFDEKAKQIYSLGSLPFKPEKGDLIVTPVGLLKIDYLFYDLDKEMFEIYVIDISYKEEPPSWQE